MKTTIVNDWDDKLLMTGEEKYPLIGSLVLPEEAKKIISQFAGLTLTGNCFQKAEIVLDFFRKKGRTIYMVYGGLKILSHDLCSSYGFDWNPPTEGHAWCVLPHEGPIDFALPGVILRGLDFRDSEGPVIEGREPVILAGMPPEWIMYSAKHRVEFRYKYY